MDITKISVGQNPPWDVHVIIEIPKGTSVVKYEIDKNSGKILSKLKTDFLNKD